MGGAGGQSTWRVRGLAASAVAVALAACVSAMVPAAAAPAGRSTSGTTVPADAVGIDGSDGRDDDVALRLPLPTSPSPGDHPAAVPVPSPRLTPGGGPPVTIGDWLIPARVLRAYLAAARTLADVEP